METLQETQLDKSEMGDTNENLPNSTDSHDAGSLLDFSMSFQEFGDIYLDKRLTFSLTETLKYDYPTLVQSKAIPILLQKKDALIQARTGSGKTLAYAIPMIQHCLTTFPNNVPKPFFGCVLVPTRELAIQVTCVFSSLCQCLSSFIIVRNTSSDLHRLSFEESPTILISTPKAFLTYLTSKQKQLGNDSKHEKGFKTFWRNKKTASQYSISSIFEKNIQCIVLDEADVLLGLGFKNDITCLFKDILKNSTPGNRQYQITLCSATFSPEVLELKSMVLYKPAIIQLKGANSNSFTNFSTGGLFEPQRNCSLCEFFFCCLPNEKYLVLYSLLKLSLLPMKCLIFVNSVQCAYTILLLLRRFSIPSAVLCNLIPFSTRIRLLSSFQQGVYEILIAVDQLETKECQQKSIFEETSTCSLPTTPDIQDPSNSSVVDSNDTSGKQKKVKETDFGVHRGVDFKGVRCVLNFDVPLTLTAYIHRIGRTARAGACGIALTLFQSTHEDEMHFLQSLQNSKSAMLTTTSSLRPLELNMQNIECFRYRVADVLQSITPKTIASVRAYELQRDLLCSARLKEHFEANPEDMKALKNAFKSIQITQQDDKHLKSIPSYFQSFVSHLQSSTAIESALLRLFESEQDPQSVKKTFKGKRLARSSDIVRDLSTSIGRKQRRSTHDIFLRNLKKEPENYTTTPIDCLPTLSTRKLKHQVKKKFTKTKKRSNRHI